MQVTINNFNFLKPNMAALKGDLGERIIKTIQNTPKVDFTQLNNQCEEIGNRIRTEKANGTY